MKYKSLLAAMATLALAACSTATVSENGDASSSASSSSVETAMEASSASVTDASSAPAAAEGDARVVDVTITDWEFSPATITAEQGEKVQLRLKGDKGIHSLLVADLGLNIRVEPGSETVVDVPTDTAGTFAGRCGVPCGPGHRDMTFAIVVE